MADKHDVGQTMAQSIAMAGKSVAEELRLCVEGNNSMWSKISTFLTNDTVGLFLLTALCMIALPWIWLQSIKLFLNILRTHDVKQGQQRLKQAIIRDRTLKDLIGQLEVEIHEQDSDDEDSEDETHEEDLEAEIHEEDSDEEDEEKKEKKQEKKKRKKGQESNHTNHADHYDSKTSSSGPGAPVLITVPISEGNENKFEQMTRKKLEADRFKGLGFHVFQSRAELSVEGMQRLHDLADEGTQSDNNFTVQLSRWRILARTAGKLTIQGLNLKGAEIRAMTFNNCITIEDFTKEEVAGGLQIWTSIVQLPSNNINEGFVLATKSIQIEDLNDITICSLVVNIQDDTLRIVLRVGIPSIIGLIYMIIGLLCLKGWHITFLPWAFVWTLPLITMALTQILPQSAEKFIKRLCEQIGLTVRTLYFTTYGLFFKQDPILPPSKIIPQKRFLQQGNALDNENCIYQDREMNHMEQREQYEMMDNIGDNMGQLLQSPPKKAKAKDRNGGAEGKKKEMLKGDRNKKKDLSTDEEEPQCFAFEEYKDMYGRVMVKKHDYNVEVEAEIQESLPFKFIYGLKDKSLWFKRDYFEVYSPALLQVLQKLLPEKVQLLGCNMVKIHVSDMFHKRDMLKRTMLLGEDLSSIEGDTDKLKSHLKHMWQFLDTSNQEIIGRYEVMKTEGCVSWDMLWAFFPCGANVEYECGITGAKLCGKMDQHLKYVHPCGSPPQFLIGLKVWDYNCQTWQSYTTQESINQYDGGRKFTSLKTHPLQFKSDYGEAEKKFLENGALFGKLLMKTRNRLMHYKGLIFIGDKKEAIDGRVMIDLSSFAKMNSNYRMGTARPSSEILRTNQVETIDISTDDKRIYAPAIVYGFSFQKKLWGVFDIQGFEEVSFHQLAFDALVMDKTKKDIVYGLVEKYERNQDDDQSHTKEEEEQVDPIVGKGSGCIFLCYGPPGTGKTFTAESVSEKLKAPLWSLSVSELGTTPKTLEDKLVKILDVAASWGAILLLDEADIYMEKRTSIDLECNAMTGIFLRNLEYYRGVLFLTTNRVVAFDDAFCSRISMFLYYGKHSARDRQIIWRNLLEPLKLQDLPDHMFEKFASYDLNAREIRNVVQVARTLAKKKGKSLNGIYLTKSLETLANSIDELKRVTGESNPHTSMIESR
ncbi:hypothetical protein KC19_2G128000 [Ceratodon purpureus]|uniref:AAA+ ATPase domain-containing protein n=1 Tax=Ceratodon purpureus TaxID=3225 RepID=A0A8T0IUV6_CERPU|nr:hypothetical protein KC19_2G128000 [Ceratodon purpureus]